VNYPFKELNMLSSVYSITVFSFDNKKKWLMMLKTVLPLQEYAKFENIVKIE